MRTIFNEEMKVIDINFPEREVAKFLKVNKNAVYAFAVNHNLREFCLKNDPRLSNKKFECDICSAGFSRARNLTAHQRKIHFL